MPTATALASVPKDHTKLLPHMTAEDVSRRMANLLSRIPEEMKNMPGDAHPARAAFGRDGWGTGDMAIRSSHEVLRVEVSVDTERAEDDSEYRQRLVDDARIATIEFLEPLVRG